MKGKINSFFYSHFNKNTTVELILDGCKTEEIEKLDNCEVDVVIKKYRKKRSLDANAYFWLLLDKLSVMVNLPKENIYKGYIRQIGGNNDVVCIQDKAVEKLCSGWNNNGIGWITDTFPSKIENCTNVILYYGSSTYNSYQMSRLIDFVIQDCKAQGIETMPPDKLEQLLSSWEG